MSTVSAYGWVHKKRERTNGQIPPGIGEVTKISGKKMQHNPPPLSPALSGSIPLLRLTQHGHKPIPWAGM